MAVGLATGMGQIWFALVLTAIGDAVIILLDRIRIFDQKRGEQKLTIVVPENLDYTEIFDDVFAEYVSNATLYKTKTVSMGSLYELNYKVILKNNVKDKEFLDELRMRNANCKVALARELNEGEL